MNLEQLTDSPQIENPTGLSLSPAELTLLRLMFAAHRRIIVKQEFGAGLSHGRVLLVRPVVAPQQPELPAVIKIAPAGLVAQEWHAYQTHVHQKLPGVAAITGPPVFLPDKSWGALRYQLMGRGGAFAVESLHYYYLHASRADVRFVLATQLFDAVGPNWWKFNAAVPDRPLRALFDHVLPVNLRLTPVTPPPKAVPQPFTPAHLSPHRLAPGDYVRLTGFIITEIEPDALTLNLPNATTDDGDSCRLRLQPVPNPAAFQLGQRLPPTHCRVTHSRGQQLQATAGALFGPNFNSAAARLLTPQGLSLPNPLAVYPDLLRKTRDVRLGRIHGDLNLENILVEPLSRTVSLVDFATARRDYVLHDFLRLETEVITKILPPLFTQPEQWVDAFCGFYQQLHALTFAAGTPPARHKLSPEQHKALEFLATIREMARQCLFDQNDLAEYYEGLLFYLLGALKFKNLDTQPTAPRPKQLAFWGAALACHLASLGEIEPNAIEPDPAELRQYLPATLRRQPAANQRAAYLGQLLHAVAAYLPRHLALALLQQPQSTPARGQFLTGTLLLADISGFAAIAAQTQAAAEELLRLVNTFLDVMLDILFQWNGQLIRFGENNILCLFTGPHQGAPAALQAAWAMKQAMLSRFNQVEVFQQVYPLSMKVGVNSGTLFAVTVGTQRHLEYVVTGSAAERTAHAGANAGLGDILISQEAFSLVQNRVTTEPLPARPDFYRVTALRHQPPPPQPDSWRAIETTIANLSGSVSALLTRLNALSPYLPAGVLRQLVHNHGQPRLDGQHRQATILFANFTGMADIIAAWGEHGATGIAADLNEYFTAVQEEAAYYGGVVNKVDLFNQGDKLMIIFGAPLAHEQDAQRAALTALAMQRIMARLTSSVTLMFLTQRIGLHSGLVLAGNVGSPRQHRLEYTVLGDTVSQAARLMAAAPPGEIWLSQTTRDQLHARFEVKPLPPVEGVPQPVGQLVGASSSASYSRWRRPLHSPLVGRQPELDALTYLLDDLTSGLGRQIAAIPGEAGAGKTRLVAEWRQQMTARPGESSPTWLTAAGRAFQQPPFGLWVELLEQLLEFTPDESQLARWRKLSARLRRGFAANSAGWRADFSRQLALLGQFLALDSSLVPELADNLAELDPKTAQLETNWTVTHLLAQAAREKPLALILDDLHWADQDSLDMLTFVLDKMGEDAPVLWLLLYRPLKDRPIWAAWQEISRLYPAAQPIAIPELPPDVGAQLLANLLQTEPASPDLSPLFQFVLRQADGNPLYIEELLYVLLKDGVLAQSESGWRLTRRPEQVTVPDTLYQLIQSRIDELDFGSPGARRLLWLAAVIGDSFTLEMLESLFTARQRHSREEFLAHLRHLRLAGLLLDAPEREPNHGRLFRFRHGLVRQVAYENMLLETRRNYHRQAGLWLESHYQADLPRHFDALAHHFEQGRQWQLASRYHHLAAARHRQQYANKAAIHHLQRLLQIDHQSVPLDASTRLWAWETLGELLSLTGQHEAAGNAYTHALQQTRRADIPQRRQQWARLCYRLGSVFERQGRLDEALAWQKRGLELLPDSPNLERAQLNLLGSAVAYHQNNLPLLKEEAARALTAARSAAALAQEAQALNNLHIYYRYSGDLAQAAHYCRQSAATYAQLGDPVGEGRAWMNLGVILFEQDEWAAAEPAYLSARRLLVRADEAYLLAMTYGNLADLYCHTGRLDEALTAGQHSLHRFTAQAAASGVIFAHAVLATVFLRRGETNPARRHLETARRLIETHQIPLFAPTVGRWLAELHLRNGDFDAAAAELQPLLALGEDELDLEAEPVQRLHGRLLAHQGDTPAAARVLENSLARLEQRQSRYQAALTRLALADVLRRRDATAAAALAEQASAALAALGAAEVGKE